MQHLFSDLCKFYFVLFCSPNLIDLVRICFLLFHARELTLVAQPACLYSTGRGFDSHERRDSSFSLQFIQRRLQNGPSSQALAMSCGSSFFRAFHINGSGLTNID